jgi:3-hydroxy-9,10-secoandrosta-1,3,5(10)-triene-9,17-dione monooxygenase reductase component
MSSDDWKMSVGRALGRIPSGVFVLTAGDGGVGSVAMLASWVQQVGFAPPMVSVAMAKGRPAGEAVKREQRFGLSVLGEKDHLLMKKYARGVAAGDPAFAGVAVRTSGGGVAHLADALAYLECRLVRACDFGGDHELLVGEVTEGKILREGASFTHLRGNGFHY